MIVSVKVDILIFTYSKIYPEQLKCTPTYTDTHAHKTWPA